jgi:hypothetical protein
VFFSKNPEAPELNEDRPRPVDEDDRVVSRATVETYAPQEESAEQAPAAIRMSSRCGRGSVTAMTPSNTDGGPVA